MYDGRRDCSKCIVFRTAWNRNSLFYFMLIQIIFNLIYNYDKYVMQVVMHA